MQIPPHPLASTALENVRDQFFTFRAKFKSESYRNEPSEDLELAKKDNCINFAYKISIIIFNRFFLDNK